MSRIEHPGAILKRKMERSGWTQDELASITGKSRQTIAKILSGSVGISPEVAVVFSAAFGDSPDEWLRWGAQYELSLVEAPVADISRKAKLYATLPVREMQRRGWVSVTADLSIIEKDIELLVGPQSGDTIAFPVAARKYDSLSELSPKELAWAFRARQLAGMLQVAAYDESRLPELARKLRIIAAYPDEVVKLSQLLSTYGIRFVIVEPLQGAKLDGAAFWIGDSPVIAMSARIDRNDNFWFTFFHELGHVAARDAYSFDSLDSAEEKGFCVGDAKAEAKADFYASDSLIPSHEMTSFISRVRPLYREDRIIQFANRVKMHPGIVLGQLHKRGEVTWGAHRKLLSKIRDLATRTTLTDGWGHSISPKLLRGEVSA